MTSLALDVLSSSICAISRTVSRPSTLPTWGEGPTRRLDRARTRSRPASPCEGASLSSACSSETSRSTLNSRPSSILPLVRQRETNCRITPRRRTTTTTTSTSIIRSRRHRSSISTSSASSRRSCNASARSRPCRNDTRLSPCRPSTSSASRFARSTRSSCKNSLPGLNLESTTPARVALLCLDTPPSLLSLSLLTTLRFLFRASATFFFF